MRGRGPDPWPSRNRARAAIVVGLLLGVLIVAVLVWVFGTWPRPGWRGPAPHVPTAPAPLPG
jgi:hypothetical protein